MSYTFRKNEHLKSIALIRQVFNQGKSFKHFPIRVVFAPISQGDVSQIAFSVPKKKFKHAVDRNRIKRQMREAYRLNRDKVLTDLQQHFGIVFIYLSNQHSDFSVIEKGMTHCMQSIADADHIMDERKMD